MPWIQCMKACSFHLMSKCPFPTGVQNTFFLHMALPEGSTCLLRETGCKYEFPVFTHPPGLFLLNLGMRPLGVHLFYGDTGPMPLFEVKHRKVKKMDKPGERCVEKVETRGYIECVKRRMQERRGCRMPWEELYNR